MKSTIKFFLVIVIAASTIFAEDGNMGNGGYDDDGNMGNGGITCTVDCPPPTGAGAQNTDDTDAQNTDENDDDSVLTFFEDYLESLFG